MKTRILAWMKRYPAAALVIGWGLMGVGVIGLILPVMPGWVFIFLGASVLAPHVPFVHRILEAAKERIAQAHGHGKADKPPTKERALRPGEAMEERETGIVDSAVRLRATPHAGEVDSWLERMDRLGIAHAVVAPADEFVAVSNEDGNRQMIDLARRRPDRFSGLAVANPWYGAKAVDLLTDAFDQGLAGAYFHAARQGFRLTEAILDPLVEVCVARRKPIYCHTGTPICCMPFQLAELARRFPEALFVMGHAAWSDFSGYNVSPAGRQAPNIVVETSCTTGGVVEALIKELGADRVVFGSGYPQSRPGLEIRKIRRLELDPAIFQKVMRDNARRLWGIAG